MPTEDALNNVKQEFYEIASKSGYFYLCNSKVVKIAEKKETSIRISLIYYIGKKYSTTEYKTM